MEDFMLKHIYTAEGDYLHSNKGEHDITSPGGIYKHRHRRAYIFKYLDQVAAEVGITKPSRQWNRRDIAKINKAMHMPTIDVLVKIFYDKYLKGAKLNRFPGKLDIIMFDMYTNTQRGAWLSVQRALLDMRSNGYIDGDAILSRADGKAGRRTVDSLVHIGPTITNHKIMQRYMIANMREYYEMLVRKRPGKFKRYIRGWHNRMNRLAKISMV